MSSNCVGAILFVTMTLPLQFYLSRTRCAKYTSSPNGHFHLIHVLTDPSQLTEEPEGAVLKRFRYT